MITKDIKYIGVCDEFIKLFEGQYPVSNGMTYNSYLITDDSIAVLDTVDKKFKNEWLNKLEESLDGRNPDYLVIHHMEPDHSANIKVFMDKYPSAKIVSSAMAFNMMKNVYGTDYPDRKIVVKENDVLDLGNHKLTFIQAPLVHWPEVLFSYDVYDKVLFSADGFGKFGSTMDTNNWIEEARRYYFGIVGKFGANVGNVLKKASNLDIKMICPLHGPILKENLSYYIDLYKIWSSYEYESKGVTICYSSVYGTTRDVALYLKARLDEKNVSCEIFDLAQSDMSLALMNAFKYSDLVLASVTYNGGIFPHMKEFINHLIDHNYQNRNITLIENGMWAPQALKVMSGMLESLNNIAYKDKITIKGAFTEDVKNKIDSWVNNYE